MAKPRFSRLFDVLKLPSTFDPEGPAVRARTRIGRMTAVLNLLIGFVVLADEPERRRENDLRGRRFEVMLSRVSSVQIESDEVGFPSKIEAKPLFRYNDPARGYVAAAVWKLGAKGRPRALITTELDRATYRKPHICYEFSSLTTTPFRLQLDTFEWTPKESLYTFRPVPNAPLPEKTPQLRLFQIHQIAERFASREVVRSEKCELRLLPKPVDRYIPFDSDSSDGAIFFFAYGTNPEVVLLIESDGMQWSFAAGRMTGADVVVLTLDDQVVWEGPPLKSSSDSPFTGSTTPIDIPGIAADGSDIKD
jgi:hypothetical protein